MTSLHGEDALRLEFLPVGRAVKLRLASRADRISFWVSYDISAGPTEHEAPWSKASIARYRVDIGEGPISYHWHPKGASRVTSPHLHLESVSASSRGTKPIGELHLPTGQVSLAAIVRFLIEELGVEPNRADWNRVLAEAEAAF